MACVCVCVYVCKHVCLDVHICRVGEPAGEPESDTCVRTSGGAGAVCGCRRRCVTAGRQRARAETVGGETL